MRVNRWRGWWASGRATVRGLLQWLGGRRRRCGVCGLGVLAFLPWRGGWKAAPPLMAALGMVGSDLDRFACPRCGCNDRDRHLKLFIERAGLADRFAGARVLHFAPEPWLMRWIAAASPARYVAADLYPSAPGIERVAMESMPFEDGAFDIVIANHVFEHVGDVDQAAREVARVLGQDGFAILQTPWCQGLQSTIEDPLVSSPEARLQLYGQDDHVRLFGRDVFERIGGDVLEARVLGHAELLPDVDPDLAGVNGEEVLMLFRPRLKAPR